LNDAYRAGTYDHGTLNGGTTGGGTEGVIFNTQTLQLLQEVPVGVASGTAAARQELRYLFRPVGMSTGAADFYVYVGHYKAGTDSTSVTRRNIEAQEVRADADALGPAAHILYSGDFNADSSNEPAEQTLLSSGNGQAFDPINRLGQWYNSSAMRDIDSEAPAINAPTGLIGGGVKNRYDLLWETAPVNGDIGLQAVPATYHTFGNDGSVPLHGAVDDPRNTALPELADRHDVFSALANDSSDHLPVLQDYRVVRWRVAVFQATPAGATPTPNLRKLCCLAPVITPPAPLPGQAAVKAKMQLTWTTRNVAAGGGKPTTGFAQI
jgi:hypothetical protein